MNHLFYVTGILFFFWWTCDRHSESLTSQYFFETIWKQFSFFSCYQHMLTSNNIVLTILNQKTKRRHRKWKQSDAWASCLTNNFHTNASLALQLRQSRNYCSSWALWPLTTPSFDNPTLHAYLRQPRIIALLKFLLLSHKAESRPDSHCPWLGLKLICSYINDFWVQKATCKGV